MNTLPDDTEMAAPFPSVEEIATIAALENPVIRNLRITASYHRLNAAMGTVVGDGDLSWCGFATWASKTAGGFIRGDEVPALVDEWLDRANRRAGIVPRSLVRFLRIHDDRGRPRSISPLLWFSLRSFATEVLTNVSDAIAEGNQDVFRHIAPPFALLLEFWGACQGRPNAEDRSRFINKLKCLRTSMDEDLALAFTATIEAAETADPRRRSQRMLYANALIGYVEQTRVQPYIVKSMDVSIEDVFINTNSCALALAVPGDPVSAAFRHDSLTRGCPGS